jgi:hypothetical protein
MVAALGSAGFALLAEAQGRTDEGVVGDAAA